MLKDVKLFGITTSFSYICIVKKKLKHHKLYVKKNKGKAIS